MNDNSREILIFCRGEMVEPLMNTLVVHLKH
jgi:hypothetical protein